MNFNDSVNKLLTSQPNLETIHDNLVQILNDKRLEEYSWGYANEKFFIKKNRQKLYEESDQHVTAVAKLLRVPKELWLLWANYVLILSTDGVKNLKIDRKLEIFKQAFDKGVKPYFQEVVSGLEALDPKCLNCDGNFLKKPLRRNVLGKKFLVQVCKRCGLGTRFPRADESELSKIYREEDYFGGDNTERGYFDYASEAPWRIEKAVKYLEKLEAVTEISPKKTRVLDVGSGYGYFQKALKDRGYQNQGIELAPDAVEFSQKTYKVDTLEGDVPSLLKSKDLMSGSFDLITLWDVVEHFYDFRKDLGLISTLLKKGGYIALRTNNIDSVEFDVFEKFFHSIKYEHTFYYTKRSLSEIFKKLDILETKVWTHSHLFLAFITQEEINNINQKNQGGDIFFVGQKQ